MQSGWLRRIVENFLLSNIPGLSLALAIRHVLDDLENDLIADYSEFLTYLVSLTNFPPPIQRAFERTIRPRHAVQFAALLPLAAGALLGIIIGVCQPFLRLGNFAADRVAKSFRFPIDLALRAIYRRPSETEAMVNNLQDQGVPENMVALLSDVTRPRPSELDLIRYMYRFPDQRSNVQRELLARGYREDDVIALLETARAYPTLSDMLSMAVREAFNDSAAQRFALDEAFPPDFAREAGKLGLDEIWAKRLWRSHWQLPSLTQAFAMLHRLRPDKPGEHFTDADLDLLMQTADVSPYFRPKLKEIAYDTFTRVDVRRMFAIHVLDEQGVYEAYLDLGYNPERAKKLTEFTVKDIADENKIITREVITEAYRDRLFSRVEAEQKLNDLGYNDADIDVLLGIIDYRTQQAELKLVLDRLELQYVEGQITSTTVQGELGQFNLPGEYVAHLLREWELKKKRRLVLPSLSDLGDLYERNIISLDRYKDELFAKGFNAERIDWQVKLIEAEIQDRATAKSERLKKEQERLRASALTKTYQQNRADLEVQIAEIAVQIADLKVARTGLADETAKAEIPAQIAELQAEKERLDLEIANLRRDLVQGV